jgi:hypothetical protein
VEEVDEGRKEGRKAGSNKEVLDQRNNERQLSVAGEKRSGTTVRKSECILLTETITSGCLYDHSLGVLIHISLLRLFHVSTLLQVEVFWVVMPCRIVRIY